MELQPAQILSHFRIAEKVGEGGMGVVYRAEDLHLQRDVALKVISSRATSTPNANERFRREALALSRLNHPNIAAIYDYDTQDGITFLVMEWISGTNVGEPTLDPNSDAELLEIADQIASGLAYAHTMRVVHGDLKPDNLRLASGGQVKILDFGLAELRAPISESASTDTLPGTRSVAGTLPYMAPELLSGQRPSPPSDVYAFGAVLYEIATGRRAFPQRDTNALTLAILSERPVPPREFRRNLSPDLEHVIMRSLEKRPDRRYQTGAELRADLKRITGGLPLLVKRRWSPSTVMRWALTIPLVALLFVLLGTLNREARPRGVPVMKALVTWPSREWSSRISPDGEWMSFLSDRGGKEALWLQRIRGGQPTLVTEQSGMVSQLWSPEGEKVAILVTRGDEAFVQILPSFGGTPATSRVLPSDFVNAHLIRWIGSGLYIEVHRQALWRLDLATGALHRVTSAESAEGFRGDFDVRDDEKQIAFTIRKGNQLTLWLSDLRGTGPVQVTTGAYNDYAPRFGGSAGEYIFFSSDRGGQVDLWRRKVTEDEAEQITFSPTAEYVEDVSADRSLLTFRELRENAHLWMLERGEHRQLTGESLQDWWPSVSRDRASVVLQRQKPRLEGLPFWDGQIVLANLAGLRSTGSWTPIADGVLGRLSPDGKRLAYVRAIVDRRFELWTKDLESAHPWRVSDRFHLPGFYPFPRDWIRTNLVWDLDGRTLYYVVTEENGGARIESSVGEGSATVLVSALAGVALHDLHVSPDGRFLGYVESRGTERLSVAHLYDTRTGSNHAPYSVVGKRIPHVHFRGWSARGWMILLEASFNPDWTHKAMVTEVSPSGTARSVAEIDRTFAGTARVDTHRNILYFIRADHDLIHNLFSVALSDGTVHQLSNNNVPGITFSGLEVAADGALLYVRQENNEDIWAIQFSQ